MSFIPRASRRLFFAAALWLCPAILWAAAGPTAFDSEPALAHPLVLGRLSQPGNPLLSAISLDASNMAALGAEPAVHYLEQASRQGLLGRISAGVVARYLWEPAQARELLRNEPILLRTPLAGLETPMAPGPLAALAQLAAAAQSDAAVSHFFDRFSRRPPLELEGLEFRGARLALDGEKVPRLGRGDTAMIDEHPRIPGAAIRTVNIAPEASMMDLAMTPEKAAAMKRASALAVAEAGAGPRLLGRGAIDGVPVDVIERVYGETLEEAFRARLYGPTEHGLVLEALRLLAAAGLSADDLKPSNIMLGRTWLDGRRRAYVVDAGKLIPLPAGLDAAAGVARLLAQDVLVGLRRYDPYVGEIRPTKPLGQILAEGLARSSQEPLGRRLAAFLRRLSPRFK